MGQRVGISEAARLTGLSVHELRRGCAAKIYPHLRVGVGKGKLVFDLDLLNNAIERVMLQSIESESTGYGQLRRVL